MSSLSLQTAVTKYLVALHEAGTPAGTIKQYRSVLRRLDRRFPGRSIASLTGRDLYAFMYGPGGITVGKAGGTATQHRCALRSLWGHAEMMGWAERVAIPQPIIRQRTATTKRTMPTRLSAAQLRLIQDAARDNPVLWAMLSVAMNTGLRISDIMKIEMDHFSLQTGELYVWVQKTQRFDAMPITLDLEEDLRAYLTWYTEKTGVRLDEKGAYLFPGRELIGSPRWEHSWVMAPERPCRYDWAQRNLLKLFAECGIQVEGGEAWHVVRRSVARIYFDSLRNEVSYDHALKQTAALLGHLNVATTEKYLGMQAEIQARNESMRGKRFLRPADNVTALPTARAHREADASF